MTPIILYQDDAIIVLDKPSGMVVNNAESVKSETVQDWIVKNISLQDEQSNADFINRSGIVHRIDKETSGLLLIAKTAESFVTLQGFFKTREVKKIYLALVHGILAEEGEINAPIGRLPWNREHFGIVPGGKESKTKFIRRSNIELQIKDKGEQVSLVEVYPETGRTHQIRVHFKYIGHPLLGDYLYGGRVQSRDDRLDFPRVMLHAWKISFCHPVTKKLLSFEAPIPDDMKRIIQI